VEHQSTRFPQHQSSPSITDVYDAWFLDLQARRCASSTVEHYRWFLAPFVHWLTEQDVETLAQITPTHIRGYVAALQARDLSGYTLLNAFRDIRRGWSSSRRQRDCLIGVAVLRYTHQHKTPAR
jgi:site-specific recombinase XerD